MSDSDYKQSIDTIIYLCSCKVNNDKVDGDRIADLNIDNIYTVSKKHMLSSMIGQILKNVGVSSEAFNKSIAQAERKIIVLEKEYSDIISDLESEEIWYMPLKGYILKDYYPSFSMREMADVDILFDESRAADVRTIMEKHGFEVKSFDEKNDDDYVKSPVANFEMHRSLFGITHDKQICDYYRSIKSKLLKDPDNGFGYHFTAEDFYIFMIAHEYKHFISCGTGLRSLLDTYVYINKENLNMEYVLSEAEKLGISNYEKTNRELSMKLFSGNTLTDDEEVMFNYIVSSGVYGNFQNYLEHRFSKDGGKKAYLLNRILGPTNEKDPKISNFKKRYAIFYKYPILLPFLPIYRLIKALKNHPHKLISEIKAVKRQK